MQGKSKTFHFLTLKLCFLSLNSLGPARKFPPIFPGLFFKNREQNYSWKAVLTFLHAELFALEGKRTYIHRWDGKWGLVILMQLLISWVRLCEVDEQVHN